MKNINSIIRHLVVGIISTIVLSQCSKPIEGLDKNGMIIFTVRDDTYEPVENISVTVYRNVDDWAWERNPFTTGTTDEKGEIVIKDLPDGEYYLDVISGNLNNWQYPYGAEAMKGYIINSDIYLHRTINGLISDADGERWKVTRVSRSDNSNVEISNSLWHNKVITFEKSGYFSIEGAEDPGIEKIEGSWWGWDDSMLSILLDGTFVTDLYFSEISENSFTATFYDEDSMEVTMSLKRL